MAALGFMTGLPALVPGNTDEVWQGHAAAVNPVAALRQQELDFQHLLQAVKYSAATNHVIGKDQGDSEESESEGSMLSGEDESQSLEYPSDDGESTSPLDLLHGDMQAEEDSTDMDGDDGEVDDWTFF
mmetsp:Transcript_36554/g.95689  ORF Transcript_36554/g.95689 Transcript_36554/m.95689 type:complete len:128 (-) Transcript_36554:130-513(-)